MSLIPNVLIHAILISFVFLCTSCGEDKNSNSARSLTIVNSQDEDTQLEGNYTAILTPLNSAVAGITSGIVELKIKGDVVSVLGKIASSPPGVKHFQQITTATSCPDFERDENNDSFIDMQESLLNADILIPLDSDLSEQLVGIDYGPISNTFGSYIYRRRTILSQMMNDLIAPDPDEFDKISKLSEVDDLKLNGRIVFIYGVLPSSNLPESVFTFGDHLRESLLPIACGQLVRVVEEEN